MAIKVIQFSLESETKNTFRFEEQPEEGQPPVVGRLYVQKWALPRGTQKVKVTIETE